MLGLSEGQLPNSYPARALSTLTPRRYSLYGKYHMSRPDVQLPLYERFYEESTYKES